jgi:hypothetical protein
MNNTMPRKNATLTSTSKVEKSTLSSRGCTLASTGLVSNLRAEQQSDTEGSYPKSPA